MATIAKRNTGTWQARVRIHGYPEQVKTFDRKRDAAEWARDIEAATREKLDRRRNRYGNQISQSTINRYLAALSVAFTASTVAGLSLFTHWLLGRTHRSNAHR